METAMRRRWWASGWPSALLPRAWSACTSTAMAARTMAASRRSRTAPARSASPSEPGQRSPQRRARARCRLPEGARRRALERPWPQVLGRSCALHGICRAPIVLPTCGLCVRSSASVRARQQTQPPPRRACASPQPRHRDGDAVASCVRVCAAHKSLETSAGAVCESCIGSGLCVAH